MVLFFIAVTALWPAAAESLPVAGGFGFEFLDRSNSPSSPEFHAIDSASEEFCGKKPTISVLCPKTGFITCRCYLSASGAHECELFLGRTEAVVIKSKPPRGKVRVLYWPQTTNLKSLTRPLPLERPPEASPHRS